MMEEGGEGAPADARAGRGKINVKIADIYKSIQGEGLLTGTESVFVRTSGCNLRCWFCDAPHASWEPVGADLSVEEVLGRIILLDGDHVVLTGGEPMLCAELVPLCRGLRERGQHITIETSGTRYLALQCDLMSISPKLSGSAPAAKFSPRWSRRHNRARRAPEVVRSLVRQYPYQIKFVIDTLGDCEEAEAYLAEFPEIDRSRVMLMPQGKDDATLGRVARWLEPYCRRRGLRFCPRKQIEWFGAVRGT